MIKIARTRAIEFDLSEKLDDLVGLVWYKDKQCFTTPAGWLAYF
jgi:hypothetical protein